MKDDGRDIEEGDVTREEKFEELAAKYEEFKVQVERHFDAEIKQQQRHVSIVNASHKSTKEQWEKTSGYPHTIRSMV